MIEVNLVLFVFICIFAGIGALITLILLSITASIIIANIKEAFEKALFEEDERNDNYD